MNKYLAIKIDSNNFAPAGKFADIPSIVNAILPNILLLAGMILLTTFIYAGFKFLASGENMEEVAKAKTLFATSAAGIAIIFGSYFLVKIIGSLLNINIPF